MKRLWITESGIIHHRKPEMNATEYVEAQPDAELLEALKSIEAKIRQKKGFYAISVGHDEVKKAHKAGILKGLDVIHEEVKQAIARAEQKGGNGV